jgi:hypothetical protein
MLWFFLLALFNQSSRAAPDCFARFSSPGPYQVLDVRDYYPDIDAGRVSEAMGIFSDGIVYKRGQSFFLRGMAELLHFYGKIRDLKGTHRIFKMVHTGDQVLVEGVFIGTHKGVLKRIHFKDFWVFGPDRKAVFRHSVLDNEGV